MLIIFLALPCLSAAESLSLEEMGAAEDAQELPQTAREEMVDQILNLAQTLYKRANGKPQRAHSGLAEG